MFSGGGGKILNNPQKNHEFEKYLFFLSNSPYNGYEKKHVLFFQKHPTMMI